MAFGEQTFDRLYQVTVGTRNGSSFSPLVTIEPPYQMTMKCEESLTNNGSALNPAVVELYNIGPDNISLLGNQNLTVVVKAGYRYEGSVERLPNDLDTIYVGDVVQVVTQNTGNNVVTTIHAQEGYKLLKTPPTNVTIPSKGNVVQAFQAALSNSNITVRALCANVGEKTTPKTTVFEGTVPEILNKICRKFSDNSPESYRNLTWSFHRGSIYIYDRFPLKDGVFGADFTIPRSRIKDTPSVGIDESTVNKQTGVVGVSTLQLSTFLAPQVTLNDTIRVAPLDEGLDDVGGKPYAVTAVTTYMDFEGGLWDTTFKGRSRV